MSRTPVGDWIARRYPPNDGSTHWMGNGDDPGCCGGPHPACTYAVARREALLSLAAEFDDLAALSGTLAPTYLLGMADAARMARERAERAPGTANSTAPVSQDHGERTDDYSAAEPTWTATRSQLIDALANIEVRGVQTSGPMAGKVIADDMADAILAQLPGGAP